MMQSIATLADNDPYLKMTPAERIAARRERKRKLQGGNVEAELREYVAEPPAPAPAFDFNEWLERQERNNPLPKAPWFSIESEIAEVITVEVVKRAVCKYTGMSMTQLLAVRRDPSLVLARQVGMYVAKIETAASYPDIGRRFGFRDHSTVMHAIRKIRALIAIDPLIAGHVASVTALLPTVPA